MKFYNLSVPRLTHLPFYGNLSSEQSKTPPKKRKDGLIPMKKVIATSNAPSAIGPYSQAIAAGDFLYVSGQIPIDPATGNIVEGGIQAQSRQSLTNVKAILEEAGLTMDAVLKTTVFLSDMNNFAAMNEVYATFFTGDCPARAAFAVADLPKGALVEIEAVVYTGK